MKAKSHVELHYWDCKTGKMHKTLKTRNIDYVGEMIKKCHENNINVIVYFSQVYDNYAYENHKNMRLRYIFGVPSRPFGGKFSRYGLVCPNNPKYKKYCKEILTELVTSYDYEGMFLDMPFWPSVCHCKHCRHRFLKETGKILPLIPNTKTATYKQFIKCRQQWIHEFMAHNTNVVKKIKPNVAIEHNMAAIGLNWVTGNTEENFLLSDYAGGDYYGGYLEQTFMCKYFNNMTKTKPFCYITSRCDSNLFFHTVSRTMQDLLIHSVNALVHNGAFSICDAMNPNGTITDKMYSGAIKEAFAITKPMEKYVSGNMDSDVAIWYNTQMKINKNFIESNLNIARVLKRFNILFDVVGTKNLKTLTSKILVMCDIPEITENEFLLLNEYVNNGGSLFIIGDFGKNDNLAKLAGIRIKGYSKYNYTYLVPSEKSSAIFEDFDTASPYPIEQRAFEAEILDEKVEILATLAYPYTKPNQAKFAAIHSNPPGIYTQFPAVTRKTLEKGSIIWIAANLEKTKATNCQKALKNIICSAIDELTILSNAPEFVEIVKWRKENVDYIAVINQQSETPVYPLSDIEISILGEYKTATLLSDGSNVRVDIQNGRTILKLPKLDVFHLIMLN